MRILEWLVLLPLWRRLIPDKTWHIPAAVVTGVVWIVLIIIIAASGGGDDDSSATVQDQGTPEPTAIATPEATETPSPTPEATPDATATPTPEPTVPDDLAAELAYLGELTTLTVDMTLLLDNFVTLSMEAEDDPTVLLGERWFDDLEREQDRLNAAQSRFLALQPPPQLADTHRLMTQALNELDIALDLFETGGRDFDADKLLEAVDHMDEATRLIIESTAALPE